MAQLRTAMQRNAARDRNQSRLIRNLQARLSRLGKKKKKKSGAKQCQKALKKCRRHKLATTTRRGSTAYSVTRSVLRRLNETAVWVRNEVYTNRYGLTSTRILAAMGDKAGPFADVLTAIDTLSATPLSSGT